jgi:hypothetical protein
VTPVSADCAEVAWIDEGVAYTRGPDGPDRTVAATGPVSQAGYDAEGALWLMVHTPDGLRAAKRPRSGVTAVIPPALAALSIHDLAAGGSLPGVVLSAVDGLRWWDGSALHTLSDDPRDLAPAVHPRVAVVAWLRAGQPAAVHLQREGGFQRGQIQLHLNGRADCDGVAWAQQALVARCGGALWSIARTGAATPLGPATAWAVADERVIADGSAWSWSGEPLPAPPPGAFAICRAPEGYRVWTRSDAAIARVPWP